MQNIHRSLPRGQHFRAAAVHVRTLGDAAAARSRRVGRPARASFPA
jgi:hypothetical protein